MNSKANGRTVPAVGGRRAFTVVHETRRSDHLKVHMKTHADRAASSPGGATGSSPGPAWSPARQFTCPDCDVSVSTIGALTAHLLTHHDTHETDTDSSGATDDVIRNGDDDDDDEESCSMCTGHVTARKDRDADFEGHEMEVDVTTTDQPINHNDKMAETGNNSDIGHSSRKNEDITVDDDDDDDDDDDGDAVALECPYCQRKDFTSVGPLAAHIRTSHSRPSDNLFACDVCGLAFSTVAKLDQHRDEQHPAELIVAKSEPISLSSPATTNVDGPTPKSPTSVLLTDDGVARFMCNFCPVQFYDEATRASHEQTIHLSRRCHGDGGGGSSSVVFQLSAGGGLTDSVSPAMASTAVFCSQCSLGFPHIYALADHMHHSHGYNNRTPGSHPVDMSSLTSPIAKSPATVVAQSAFDATSASSKSTAGGRRDPVKPTAVRADSVELRQPPRGGASVGGLDTKQISTSSSSSLMLSKCVECSATFDNDDDLDCHVTAAHYLSLATEFGCTSCLKLFARPDDLQKHLMDVHAHHLYRCTLCKQVFDSKVNIQVHFAVRHSNECQVYRCTKCSMVFHSEMEWQLHVRVHHLGVARPYRCFFCRDGFSSELELSAHVAAHKKPFSCPLCGESFLVEFLLDRHLEMKHPCLDSAAMPLGAKLPLSASGLGSLPPPTAGEVSLATLASQQSPKMLDLRQTISSLASQGTAAKRDEYQTDREPSYIDSFMIKNHHRPTSSKNGSCASLPSADKSSVGNDSKLTQVCVYCSTAFKTKSELEKHVKTTHMMPTTSQKCNICDELFPSAAVLAEHKLTHCKVVHGNVCVVCKATMQTEEEFIIHSQQHSSTSQGASSRQVSPQSTTGAGASNSAGHVTTMPCIVCRQTLVSFLELRLHARHHFQSQQQVLPTPPPQGLSVPPSTAGLRSRYVCCVCLGQFDSADSVISRAGGYFVCVACSCRDNGLVIFDAGQSAVRTGTGATDPLSLPPLPRTYQCIKCQESFSSELDVRVHVTCHMINEGNIHECRLCECDSPVTFDSPARLQSHIIAEHEFGTDPSSSTTAAASGDSATSGTGVIRPCTVCGVTLVGPSAARVHALDHGPSTWPHVCQQCPLRFFFAAELKNHQLVTGHHQAASGGARSPTTTVASSPGPTDDLRCPECSRMFSGYASLCSHRRVHEKPVAMTTAVTGVELLMQDCAARCSSLDGLYSTGHVTENGVDGLTMSTGRDKMPLSGAAQVKGPSTPLQCPECSRQFPSLSSLQGHMRVHNSGTKYSCNECGKSFSLPQNLAIHMNSHRDDLRPHECTTCHKRFAKKENLKSHMRSHSNSASSGEMINSSTTTHIPEYFSVQCLLGAVSPTPKSTRPNRCLGGAKPVEHLCPICGGRFLQTTDLAVHLTKIHGIKAEVVEAEIASAAAAALPNSSDDNSVDEGFCAAMENATSSNSSSGGIHRLRSNSDLDLHASPALSVK